jgi:hypothetical protein
MLQRYGVAGADSAAGVTGAEVPPGRRKARRWRCNSVTGAPARRTSFGFGQKGKVRCKLIHSAWIQGIGRMHADPSSAASLRDARHAAEYEPEPAREPAEGLQSSGHRPTVWRRTTRPEVRSS